MVVVVGPQAPSLPVYNPGLFRIAPPVVQVKQDWGDSWETVRELRAVRATQCTSGDDLDTCELVRSYYGNVKLPWESALGVKPPWGESFGWWVRLLIWDLRGWQPVWIGQISNADVEPFGAVDGEPTGRQGWVAYGPQQILRKIHVSNSYWTRSGALADIGWTPDVNLARDGRGETRGNRSSSKLGDTYVFGGSDVWSNYDFAEYLLDRFADESDTGGPSWTLAGQTDALKQLYDTIPISEGSTLADLLREAIPLSAGLDYHIRHSDSGFTVWVFALSPFDWSYAGINLPRNNRSISIATGLSPSLSSAKVVHSNDYGYQRLRVIGERIVSVCTLRGATAPEPHAGSLIKNWATADETAYKAGYGGLADPDTHDLCRQKAAWSTVYQRFGAPVTWDFNDYGVLPKLDKSGNLVAGEHSDYQIADWRVLPWLPLEVAIDYQADPPDDKNPSDREPDFLRPAVWIGHLDPTNPFCDDAEVWSPVEKLGIGVSVSQTDFGFSLKAPYNHMLAHNHWSGAADTFYDPFFDYETLVATIAVEIDQRLTLDVAMPNARPSGGVLDVLVPDAHFWWLSPHTVVGTTDDLQPAHIGATGRILRNDVDVLRRTAAGVISRYLASRSRAQIRWVGLMPLATLLGSILRMVESGGIAHRMAAPITRIEWTFPETDQDGVATTTLHAGFAR